MARREARSSDRDMIDVKDILLRYERGEITSETDESGAGGLWDLAGELAGIGTDREYTAGFEKRQDAIYTALQEVRELSSSKQSV
jgi:hypothetical protein